MKWKHENMCCSNTANWEDSSHSKRTTTAMIWQCIQWELLCRVKEHSMMLYSCLVFSNCLFSSQESRFKLHFWPHDSSLFPYRKWLFLILFHKLPNSFHWNPLPLEALDTAKLCSELVCRSYLCCEWQFFTASSPAQTPTARSVKPGHNSELWCWAGNNQVLSLSPRQRHRYVEIISKPRSN